MSLSSVVVREAGSSRDERPAAVEPDGPESAAEGGAAGFVRRAAVPDVLDLLLLHGDCAFLLDLRELCRA